MKKLLVLALILLASSSCSKLLEPLYVHLPDTEWVYELNGVRAIVHFDADHSASVLQKNLSTGAVLQNQGSWWCDGHRAVINCADGTTFKFVRTFSNLKNSKNRNMSRYYPVNYSSLVGTVWAALDLADLYVLYFKDEEQVMYPAFTIVQYEEGVPYGWNIETRSYTLNGNHVVMGTKKLWLFPDALFFAGRWYLSYPVPKGSGSAEVTGSAWFNIGGGSTSAGLCVFDTGYSFTRLQVVNRTQILFQQGSYIQDGNNLEMTLDGVKDQCSISGNRFRFMERTYERFP